MAFNQVDYIRSYMRKRRKSNLAQIEYDRNYRRVEWLRKQEKKLHGKDCLNCKESFKTTRNNKVFCSRFCMRVLQRKNWIKNNFEKHKLLHRQHTAARRNGLTIQTIQDVYEKNIKQFGTLTCCLCFTPILFGTDSLEHLKPLSRGGTNRKSNLAVAHNLCNKKKNSKTVKEYFQWQALSR